jgi:hypothetical protein
MRVYKVSEYLSTLGQTTVVIPSDLGIEEKHKRLNIIKSEDILYVQKWRNDFNSAQNIGQYKGKCRIVFDIDDLSGDKQALDLISLSDALVVGNHFLYGRYSDGKRPIFVIPSPVDLAEYPKFKKEGGPSISMAKCGIGPMLGPLGKLKDVLNNLWETFKFDLILVGFQDSGDVYKAQQIFPYAKCFELRTYDRYLTDTVPMLQMTMMSILPFIKRDEGKSGHSLLANMAMGIPTCASSYAECGYIIQDGINGLIACDNSQWYDKIERLFRDSELRSKIRQAGWRTITEKYDVPVVARSLLECLRKV